MNKTRRKRWLAPLLLLVLAGGGLYLTLDDRIAPGMLALRQAAPPQGAVVTVKRERIAIRRELVGTVEPRVPVDAASRVSATITAVTVHASDPVRAGQVLVYLDAAELKARVREASEQLAAARVELARAAADQRRFKSLLAHGAATPHEFDAAEAAFRTGQARVEQAKAAVAALTAALKYATVKAPAPGVVAARLVEPGDLALPGKPLIRLYNPRELRIRLDVPEKLISYARVGTPLTVVVEAAERRFALAVSEVVPTADPATRSFIVRADLPPADGLRPGMFVRASLQAGTEEVLVAPRAAVTQVGQLATVRVLSAEGVELRQLALGRLLGDQVEVLAGLSPGDKLLLGPAKTAQSDR